MNRSTAVKIGLITLGVATGYVIYSRYFKKKKNLTDKKEQKEDKPKEKKRKINFKLPDFEGNFVSLDDYKGKYVLVDIWQTSCPICREKNKEIASKKSGIKAEILGICLDLNTKEELEKAAKEDNITWKQLKDPGGKFTDTMEVSTVPFMFLINPEGYVVRTKINDLGEVNKIIAESCPSCKA